MAKGTINSAIELTGEEAYTNALNAINAELKALKSEADLVSSSMDDMTDSEEANAAKSDVLTRTLEAQQAKLKLLNEDYERNYKKQTELADALAKAKEEFAANSTEVVNAQNAYNKQVKEVQYVQAALNKLNTDINKTNHEMRDLGKSTDDLNGSFAEVERSGGKIKDIFAGNVLADAASAVAGTVANIAGSFLNLDQATEETRENLSKVDSAFTTSGKSSESARKAYKDFYKILGDSDTAAESTQLLAQLAENEQDVDKWTRTATGVMATFGDSLPINSLIEASNETAKVGTVTGVLADALNWVGISEDEFNEKLAALGTEQERNALITETLAATYEDAAAAYEENNAGIMTARDLQAQLDESLANLGGTVQDVKNGLLADFLPSIVEVINGFDDFVNGVDGADKALEEGIGNMVDTAIEKLPEFLEFGAKVIGEIARGLIMNFPQIAAAAAKMVWTLIATITGLDPDIFSTGIDMVKQAADGAATMIKQFVSIGTNLVSGLWEGIKEKSSWLKNQIKGWCSSIVDNAKDFFHINSPSKVFRDQIGQAIPEGLALGIDKGAKTAFDSMKNFNQQLLSAGEMIVPQASQSAQNQGLVESLINGLGVMQDKAVTVVAQVVLPNGEVLAETVFNDLLNVSKQRGVSLATT
nr:MAG TPA: minor tail protein [Caudoviricetes sp.]